MNTHPDNTKPQFTEHLNKKPAKVKEVSPALDKAISDELANKPSIMKEEK
jgi:hypothetical protein